MTLKLEYADLNQKKDHLELGSDVTAIGFGKHNYSLRVFDLVDLLFPTIMRGILSKKIEIS